jgi:protein-disulfide isomerase
MSQRVQGRQSGRSATPARWLAAAWLVVLIAGAGLVWAVGTAASARAAELVMFESPACHYCTQWHEEIGPIYPKTAESRRAPLRRVNLHDTWPADLTGIRAVSFTPTFVLMEDGAEVGRITGYAGDEFFWFQLGALMQKLPGAADDGGS